MNIAEQLHIGISCAKEIAPPKLGAVSKLIICGMGGSIMPAEALVMLWLNQPLIYINRTAYLPHWVGPEHTVICISWSGNTEETINCFQEAVAKKIPVWTISSGGRLAKLAPQQGQPLVLLPSGMNPRDALSMMFSALLTLLNQVELVQSHLTELTLISRSDIIESSVKSSSFDPGSTEALARDLAAKIGSKTPLLYSSYPWRYLGSFWKILFNEKAKIHAFFNFLPGAGHNEIAGIQKEDPYFFYLLLRDSQDHPENIKKIDQWERFLKSYRAAYQVIPLDGKNRFGQIMNQYLLASATSTALAHRLGTDPHSTEIIENFKQLS